MNMEQALRAALAAQTLRDLDLHFALSLRDFALAHPEAVMLAGALASAHTGEGHVCVPLDEFAGSPLFAGEQYRGIEAPALDAWRTALRASGVVGQPGDYAPLILDHADRLYLARYFYFERAIADHLRARAEASLSELKTSAVRTCLDRHFPPAVAAAATQTRHQAELPLFDPPPDHQRLAAAIALLRPLAVIAGGPGTGKTTTVTRLLALVIEQSWPYVPRIALVAPTGKAAARLAESIKAQKAHLDCRDEIRAALPEQASTLHRLLKAVPGRTGFRHDAANPLHLDLLVVDEVSMVDVPTMARLLEALPATARLVLLGDPDQLASVEAGSVLGDICNRDVESGYSDSVRAALTALATPAPAAIGACAPMRDSRVILERSRRFGEQSGIGELARTVNAGDAQRTLQLLGEARPDVGWRDLDESTLSASITDIAVAEYTAYLKAPGAREAIEAFHRFRFLCALREGPFGVEQVNRVAEQALRKRGLLNGNDRFYAGRPIMVTRNDYTLGLFNGDVGVIWPDSDDRLRAFFTLSDGSMKKVLLTRLPEHETVFAMTIHKSQGSEFDRCVVVLPDRDTPVLSRELLYTGITRARQAVELWGSARLIATTVERRIQRRSGLRDTLWGLST